MPAAKRPSEGLDAPRDRYGDFEVKREWWTGDAVPDVQVVRREIAGMPHVQVIGLKERWSKLSLTPLWRSERD